MRKTIEIDTISRGNHLRLWIDILRPLLLPLLSSRQKPYHPRDDSLRGIRRRTESEALPEARAIHRRVRQERQPGVKGIAGRIHDAQDDSTLLGIRTADLVGPRHAQRAVGDRGSLHEEGEPLQADGNRPDGQAQGGEKAEECRDGHDGGPASEVVGQNGEADCADELDGVLGRGNDVLLQSSQYSPQIFFLVIVNSETGALTIMVTDHPLAFIHNDKGLTLLLGPVLINIMYRIVKTLFESQLHLSTATTVQNCRSPDPRIHLVKGKAAKTYQTCQR